MKASTIAVIVILALGVLGAPLALPKGGWGAEHTAPPETRVADWPAYGRDPGGSRYSPLAQINRDNVKDLTVAWTYRTGDVSDATDVSRGVRVAAPSAFEATPILVDDTLYLCTPFSRVIALDPETGAERWTYDPHIDLSRWYANQLVCRGVSTWLDPTRSAGQACGRRIFLGTNDGRLVALDAAAGRPCADFGQDGHVDLTRGVREVRPGSYQVTSPPAVIGDLVIVGSAITDNQRVEEASGVVRAFDARTGALRWRWDPIPRTPHEPGWETWQGESAVHTGAANVWSIISADPERDLVFLPTSSPSPDYYGGERLRDNLYADAVVALRASTGTPVWHFQVVHHDLWDYDVPAQPSLVMVRRDGHDIPAVAVATKMGHLFFLHRETGQPLFLVEERPVPQGAVPGEAPAPTQPFPTAPRPLVPQALRPEDTWGLTESDRDWCRTRITALRSEGIFTPPSLQGTIMFPGNVGGANWSGVSFEPARGLLIVNTNRLAFVVSLIPREHYEAERKANPGAEISPQAGTPYGMRRELFRGPSGLPCNPPPWGTLAAVDVATGVIRWEVPLGTMPELAQVPGSSQWGSPNLGGSIVTAGGLVFIAAARDASLRAFDVETGQELWKGQLPASAQATPMTYRLREAGKQFVVIAAGGHGKLRTTMGDYVVAFTLP